MTNSCIQPSVESMEEVWSLLPSVFPAQQQGSLLVFQVFRQVNKNIGKSAIAMDLSGAVLMLPGY